MKIDNKSIGPVAGADYQRRRLLSAVPGAIAIFALPAQVRAQAWPSRPIRLIAAQAPGSSNDATARAFADFFSSRLGMSVVVENKPGGVGMIAAEAVARSAPDGYTLLVTLHSQLAQAPVLLKRPPIDTSKDLTPIAALSTGSSPMVVRKDLPVNNLTELIALARKQPVTVGNYGIGSGWQLQMVQLTKRTGGQFNILNYKGTGAMLADLVAGQIDVGGGSLAGLGPSIQQGSLRPIVIISGGQSRKLPGVPTWADEGFTGPAFEHLREVNMLLGPAGMPPDVVARLTQLADESTLQSPRIKALREMLDVEGPVLVGEPLRAFIEQSWPVYRSLTKEIGLSVEG